MTVPSQTKTANKNRAFDSAANTLVKSLGHAISTHADTIDTPTLGGGLVAQFDSVTASHPSQISLPCWKIKKVAELVQSKLHDNLHIAEIARACSLSRSHFSRAFKQAVGISPSAWIMDCKIHRAQEMLMVGKLNLADISQECGFADQAHFSRTFRKIVGMTPSKWRQCRSVDQLN